MFFLKNRKAAAPPQWQQAQEAEVGKISSFSNRGICGLPGKFLTAANAPGK